MCSTTDSKTWVDPTSYTNVHTVDRSVSRMSSDEIGHWLTKYKWNSGTFGKIQLLRHVKLYSRFSEKPVQDFQYFFVVDIEATCEKNNPVDYYHEIIEFALIVVNSTTLETEGVFQSYCKPSITPLLSDFCKQYTGITQDNVNSANSFIDLNIDLKTFLNPFLEKGCCMITDSGCDVYKFIAPACGQYGIDIPYYFHQWCNIKVPFSKLFRCKFVKLSQMIRDIGLTFSGTPHTGKDDAKNISRILVELIQLGVTISPNESIQPSVLEFLSGIEYIPSIAPSRHIKTLESEFLVKYN